MSSYEPAATVDAGSPRWELIGIAGTLVSPSKLLGEAPAIEIVLLLHMTFGVDGRIVDTKCQDEG